MLVITRQLGKPNPSVGFQYEAKCDCGKTSKPNRANLKAGRSMSCGCTRWKHGHTSPSVGKNRTTDTYMSYRNMISRCCYPHDKAYHNYGGRGIKICERWMSFANFLEDMGIRPSRKYTLERNNNSLGYSKENCRWATLKEQANNRRDNHIITVDGESRTIKQWSEYRGIQNGTIHARLRLGWTERRAVLEPIQKQFSHNKTNAA